MPGPTRTLPMVIGRTENVLRSLLAETLVGTGVDGYDAWVALNRDGTTDPDTREQLAEARRRVAERTSTLASGLDLNEVAVTMRVLDVVRENAERMLGD